MRFRSGSALLIARGAFLVQRAAARPREPPQRVVDPDQVFGSGPGLFNVSAAPEPATAGVEQATPTKRTAKAERRSEAATA